MAERVLITVADDFGLTESVNDAVERAHAEGMLTSASLMVGAPAAADAVARARLLPKLAVGLHLVVIEGRATLPPAAIPGLVDAAGWFGSDQLALGLRYAFDRRARRQLAAEIRAQFEAFAATGLALDHANAHKHMHLHPVVGAMMIGIGREFGLRAIRVPAEPALPGGPRQTLGDRALRQWCRILRRQARRAGMVTNDHILGLGWTGHMTPERVQHLMSVLPAGASELYSHPAAVQDDELRRLMPEYEPVAELAALLAVRPPSSVRLATYGELIARPGALPLDPTRGCPSGLSSMGGSGRGGHRDVAAASPPPLPDPLIK